MTPSGRDTAPSPGDPSEARPTDMLQYPAGLVSRLEGELPSGAGQRLRRG